MPPRVQAALESSLEVPLRPVRVHADARSAAAVESLGARAFTYGLHVFLGPRERPDDLPLMAHEVAHVVQQQGRHVLQLSAAGAAGDGFEQEAHSVAGAVGRGEKVTVRGRTGGARVQGVWPVDEMADWARERAWALLNEYAPQLVPILRRGVLEWLKERLGAVLQSVFDELSRPVRAVREVASSVGRHFGNLVGWLREAAAKIARNDCGPISEAAGKIQQVFEGLTAPVIQRVQHFTEQARGFFRGLGERFGAPLMDIARQVGGAVWGQIQRFGHWIGEATQPIRATAGSVWRWFKNWLGIGSGEEGHNGVLQWFQRKAGEAWNWVLARIAPFRRPLMVVAGVLVMLSPAGPIVAVAGLAAGIMRGVQWIRTHFRSREGVVRQQSFLRGTILPAILGAINSVGGAVRNVANNISGALHRVMDGISEMAGAVNSVPILSFAGGLIGFVADAFRGLLSWADEGVRGLADWVQGGLERLGGFARMMVNFLEEVGRVAADVRRLAYFLAGRLWNAIPSCIRDPFIDFFIPLILRQIPFFRELASTPEAWQQTRADVMLLIRQFFRDFDLMGAMRTAFRLLLRALRVPVDLAAQVLQKAARSWDVVLASPVRFLQNLLRAAGQGFRRFFGNILSHLWYGVQGWLFNQLGDIGITPPATWDLRGVFGLILQVAGVSLEHVLELLARRVGRPVVERIRRAINFLTGAWEWVRVAITEGPAGLWRMLVERLRDLGRMVLESAVGWIMQRIIAQVSVRLTALFASAGLSAVVEAFKAFYNAVQTALEYARRILEILNTVFDTILQIAQGVFGPAAEMLERGLRMAMPVVIGFLANYLGLGGIGERIREIILGVRERVDAAILWLIDRALAAGRALLTMLGLGQTGAEQDGQISLERPVRFAREGHRLKATFDGRSAAILMASNGFKDLSEELTLLRRNYIVHETDGATIQGHFMAGGHTQAADELDRRLRVINDRKRAVIIEADRTPPRRSAILSDGLNELKGDVEELGDFMVSTFGQALGAGAQVTVGAAIFNVGEDKGYIVTHTAVIQQGHFGILVESLDHSVRNHFLLYIDYPRTWRMASATQAPPWLGFAGSPGGGVRLARNVQRGVNLGGQIASYTPPGWTNAGHWNQRGHLVSKEFGGKGDDSNIVAMTHTANHDYAIGMRKHESDVSYDVAKGAVFVYKVSPDYKGKPYLQFPPEEVNVEADEVFPNNTPRKHGGKVNNK